MPPREREFRGRCRRKQPRKRKQEQTRKEKPPKGKKTKYAHIPVMCRCCGAIKWREVRKKRREQLVAVVEAGPREAFELPPEFQVNGIQPLGSKTRYKPVAKKRRAVGVQASDLPEELTRELPPTPIQLEEQERHREEQAASGPRLTPERIEKLKIGKDLWPAEREYLIEEFKKRDAVFAFKDEERGSLREEYSPPVRIYTVPHQPWNDKPLRLTEKEEKEVVEVLRTKMRAGVCEYSRSPYASRWFMVRKPNGKLRWIQDLQKLNGVVIRNTNRGPTPDEVTERLAGQEFYSNVDLFSGYDQILIDARDRPLTAMHTPIGAVQLRVLPQGYANAVAEFQRCMCDVLEGLVPDRVIPHLDDLSIRDRNHDETVRDGIRECVRSHIQTLLEMLDRLLAAGLTVSGEKSEFLHRSMKILGYRLSREGRHMAIDKLEALKKWETPTDLRTLRGFVNFCSVYRILIPRVAHIARLLFALTRKGQAWKWTSEEEEAFEALRTAMLESQALVRPDYEDLENRPFIVTTDAGPTAIGACLAQRQPDGKRRPIRWESHSLNENECGYHQLKRELLAVVYALRKFERYVHGTTFELEMDPIPLVHLLGKISQPDPTMKNWNAYIRQYDFVLKRIPSTQNKVADGLSRSLDTDPDGEAIDGFLLE